MQKIVIRTLEDFLKVPEPHLGKCLQAFRAAIQRAKAQPFPALTEFTWKPTSIDERGSVVAGVVTATTKLTDVRLRRDALAALAQQNIYCIEDLTLIAEDELLAMPGLGRTSVTALREALREAGMTFGVHDDVERAMWARARAAHATPAAIRAAQLNPESDVRELGLRIPTLIRVLAHRIETIAELRKMSLRMLASDFGRSQAVEIIRVLTEIGLPIEENVSNREMWRIGLIDRDELVIPVDDTTVIRELMPWLGQKVNRLHQGGVRTLGELKRATPERLRAISGIGDRSVREIHTFLGQAETSVTTSVQWFGRVDRSST